MKTFYKPPFRKFVKKQTRPLQLSIEDDGCGFDPGGNDTSRKMGGGFGLRGMRDRAELNDGELRVDSAPGFGTRIVAVFPLAKSDTEPST